MHAGFFPQIRFVRDNLAYASTEYKEEQTGQQVVVKPMQERTLASKLPYLKLKRFLVEDLGKTVLVEDERHMECLCHLMRFPEYMA